MAEIDKLLKQVRYIKGKVMNDPQTYSETHVSGGGGGGTGHHRSNVSKDKVLKDENKARIPAGEDVDGQFNYSEFGTRTDVKPRTYFQVTIPPHSFRQFNWEE